jgi:hypothetical protein
LASSASQKDKKKLITFIRLFETSVQRKRKQSGSKNSF